MNIPDQLSNANWLHLDMKGTVPSLEHLLCWIDRFAEQGFNGIVFEYEDRLDWKTWPGVFRPGFSWESLRAIHDRCERNHLEIVPLIQVHGHLEWLLKHERYAFLRENGRISELCPSHPKSRELMIAFIDECLNLHPDSRYIHLGADETWGLGSCPACSTKAATNRHGKLGLYIDHIGPLCEYLLERGRTPLVWADIWRREQRMDLCRLLPAETVFVEWQYRGDGPFDHAKELLARGCRVMGASAISCNYPEVYFSVQQPIQPRIDNVIGWHKFARKNNIGIIHTTWNRGSGVRPIYGPWHGQTPAYIAAGCPASWDNGNSRDLFSDFDAALQSNAWDKNINAEEIMKALESSEQAKLSTLLQESLVWLNLALKFSQIVNQWVYLVLGSRCMNSVNRFVGIDKDWLTPRFVDAQKQLCMQLNDWELAARAFWQTHTYNDAEEFFATRCVPLRELQSQTH